MYMETTVLKKQFVYLHPEIFNQDYVILIFRKATKEEIEEYNKLINQKDEDSDRYNIL